MRGWSAVANQDDSGGGGAAGPEFTSQDWSDRVNELTAKFATRTDTSISVDWVGLFTAIVGGVILSLYQGVIAFFQGFFLAIVRGVLRALGVVDRLVIEVVGTPIPIVHAASQSAAETATQAEAFAAAFAIASVALTAYMVGWVVNNVR
jgi:hypothetical protein